MKPTEVVNVKNVITFLIMLVVDASTSTFTNCINPQFVNETTLIYK
jgi:hypothetical protein